MSPHCLTCYVCFLSTLLFLPISHYCNCRGDQQKKEIDCIFRCVLYHLWLYTLCLVNLLISLTDFCVLYNYVCYSVLFVLCIVNFYALLIFSHVRMFSIPPSSLWLSSPISLPFPPIFFTLLSLSPLSIAFPFISIPPLCSYYCGGCCSYQK